MDGTYFEGGITDINSRNTAFGEEMVDICILLRRIRQCEMVLFPIPLYGVGFFVPADTYELYGIRTGVVDSLDDGEFLLAVSTLGMEKDNHGDSALQIVGGEVASVVQLDGKSRECLPYTQFYVPDGFFNLLRDTREAAECTAGQK